MIPKFMTEPSINIIDDVFAKYKVVLNKGEVAFGYFKNIYCLQEKTIQKNVSYAGIRYSSGYFRAGNLSYSTTDIKTFIVEDYGELLLTNKRIVFAGKQKNFSLSITIGNILDYYLYKDGILLCRSNRKNVLFKEAQFNNYAQSDNDYCFLLNDFSIQFVSIIGRIANQTENKETALKQDNNTIKKNDLDIIQIEPDEKREKNKTYVVNKKNLISLDELPKTGSYNDIAESIGYPTFHGIITFESEKIEYIAFKQNTKEPIFVEAKDDNILSYSDIVRAIDEIDWEFERHHRDWNG